MKKFFFAAMVAVSVLLASCSETDETTNAGSVNEDGPAVKISLSGGETPALRSFFENTAQAEPWEKTINTLTVFGYNSDNGFFVRRVFSAEELSAMTVTFCMPSSRPGDNCEFYAVANLSTEIRSRAELVSLIEGSVNLYNGSFSDVISKSMRPGGFVMADKTTRTIAPEGTITGVNLSLRRLVAKFSIETEIASEFHTKYPGAGLRIDNVKVLRAATTSLLVEQYDSPSTGSMNYTGTQVPANYSGAYQNLFYLYENADLPSDELVMLEIDATYDVDGNFSTVTDQYPQIYTVPLGNSEGRIIRNNYYRMQVNITGLTGSDTRIGLQVADWEGPHNQSVDVGN